MELLTSDKIVRFKKKDFLYSNKGFHIKMKLYLIDLIKFPELKNELLGKILAMHSKAVIEIPNSEVPLTMGRNNLADIVLRCSDENSKEDYKTSNEYLEFVSRNHCIIHANGLCPYVVDIGSKNGTFVDGEKVASDSGLTLEDGCRLSLGPYTFKVFFGEELRNSNKKFLKDTNHLPLTKTCE